MQGCKSVSSIGVDDQHILVTFLILGDDFKISIFDDLFLLTRLFFIIFCYNSIIGDGGQILGWGWGDVSPIPPGICSPVFMEPNAFEVMICCVVDMR